MRHTSSRLMAGKIHCCHVTDANLNYSGSVTTDLALLEAAGLFPNQEVEIWNVTNGERFSTYILPSEKPPGSGEICLNGSAARRVQITDKLIICAYAEVDLGDILFEGYVHKSHVALVENPENRLQRQFRTEVRVYRLGSDEVPPGVLLYAHPSLPKSHRLGYHREFLAGY